MSLSAGGASGASSGALGAGAAFSFKFSKTSEKKTLVDSKLRDESTKNVKEETDFVKEVNDKEIQSSKKKEEKKELIIPLIKKNVWKGAGKGGATTAGAAGGLNEEDEAAAQEILADTREKLAQWEERGQNEAKVREIPLLIENAIPKGFEEEGEETINVELRAEQSSMEDYEAVPVEEYGLAMLRGMGWKAKEGIGGFNKKVVKSVEPVIRPKGLGLGAAKPNQGKDAAAAQKDSAQRGEELKMEKGAFCCVLSGSKKGMFGQIEGLDEEAGRVFIKLALGSGDIISVSENGIKLVHKREYKEKAKVINNELYDKYKEKQNERERDWDRKRKEENGHDRRDDKDYKNTKRSRSKSPNKRDKYSEKSHSHYKNGSSSSSSNWIRPLLKVRFIDKRFKSGKYFNCKMIVEDVTTPETCVLRNCENGRILEDIDNSYLETIIPKGENGVIMIVRGKHKGQLGVILQKDKYDCIATLQLIQHREEVLKLSYDDICEYTGEVPDL